MRLQVACVSSRIRAAVLHLRQDKQELLDEGGCFWATYEKTDICLPLKQ